MKIAKVSPVYEGKISGGQEEDEVEEAGRSRMARENAKARIRNIRRVSVSARRPYQRRMVTRSMAPMMSCSSSSLDTIKENEQEEEHRQEMNDNEGKEEVVEPNEKEREKKKQEVIVIDVDEIKDNPQAEAEVPAVPVAAGGGGVREEHSWPNGWYDGLDEWPMTWSYGEDWLLSGTGLGFGLNNPQWEYIDGVGWIDKRPSV